jgi:r-opsin
MNLAVSDMLLLITMLPGCIYNFWTGGPWRQGETLCYAHAFCGTL